MGHARETAKMSPFELESALSKLREARGEREDDGPERHISGERPAVRPTISETGSVRVFGAQLAAVERPVGEANVVQTVDASPEAKPSPAVHEAPTMPGAISVASIQQARDEAVTESVRGATVGETLAPSQPSSEIEGPASVRTIEQTRRSPRAVLKPKPRSFARIALAIVLLASLASLALGALALVRHLRPH